MLSEFNSLYQSFNLCSLPKTNGKQLNNQIKYTKQFLRCWIIGNTGTQKRVNLMFVSPGNCLKALYMQHGKDRDGSLGGLRRLNFARQYDGRRELHREKELWRCERDILESLQ